MKHEDLECPVCLIQIAYDDNIEIVQSDIMFAEEKVTQLINKETEYCLKFHDNLFHRPCFR